MKALAITFSVLGYAWLVLVGLVIIGCSIAIGIREGFGAMMWLFSPFNIWNWIAMVISFLPGIGLLAIADKLSSLHGAKKFTGKNDADQRHI